jgi:cathepsin L
LAPVRRFARGARVPDGLRNRIKAQNAAARSITETLTTDFNFLKTLDAGHPLLATQPTSLPAQFQAPLTAVKNQGYSCGSCWAFAAIAAYEAAYLKTNKKTIDVSEQEALDCTFFDNNCITGGWHESVLLYLKLEGLIGSDRYPYRETKQLCTANMARDYYALNWDYVQGAVSDSFIPPDAALKQALYRYGALATAVLTHSDDPNFKNWDGYAKRFGANEPNPRWPDYRNGVFDGTPTKELKGPDIGRADHEVLMYGWDDTLGDHGCWLIKNSWGIDWGDEGLMKLPYGSCNIGFAASWVTAMPIGGLDIPLMAKLKGLDNLNELKTFYPAMK